MERSGTMKAPVGLLSDRTVLRQQDGGDSPRQVRVCKYRNPLRPLRVQIPPFVTCGDIFPRPGEVFPLRGSFIGAFRQLQRARPSGELAKPSGFDWEGLCCPDKFQFGELKKRNLPIKTYKLLTIKLLYSMFLINYYIGVFVWKWMEDFLSPK